MTASSAGILLAAGAGSRMGLPKALFRTADGTAWVSQAITALAAGGCEPIFAVLGAGSEQVQAKLAMPAQIVLAPDWPEGMGASLRAGLRAATQCGPAVVAVIVTLVDTPGVTPQAVARLRPLAAPAVLARSSYHGVPGHPVLIGRRHWAAVLETAVGDTGARGYLAGQDVVLVESGDVASGRDIDLPEDLNGSAPI